MVKTDKLCTRCGKPIHQIRDIPIANHTNVEHPDDIHYFCGRDCKLIWLAERMEKSDESDKETFKCKYCEKEWDKKISAIRHEAWCDKNPKSRSFIAKERALTIKDIKEIDKLFGLSDKQIARFVRSGKWVK